MDFLYQRIQQNVRAWREDGYPTDDYPAVAEILDCATLPESDTRRFLRKAQLRALETYWYLRLVEGTPHIFELYRRYYPKRLDLLAALGLDRDDIKNFVLNEVMDALWLWVREDQDFVKDHKLESVHELADVDYAKILPPRLHRPFEATYKLIFTRKGEKDIPVIRGSRYNLVGTNTEKIRIQKRSYRHYTWSNWKAENMLGQYEAEANPRLRAVASLPNLGLFSDEAHHTYGQEMGKRLKRVRQTVDYLHEKRNVIAVVNTTGTPYYEQQPLRDVVTRYGLSKGIRDGILKSVEGKPDFLHQVVGFPQYLAQGHIRVESWKPSEK